MEVTLSQSSGLVRANIRHSSKRLKRVHLSYNDIPLRHNLGSDGHGDGKHDDQRCRNHTETGRDSIDDDFIGSREGVCCFNYDGTDQSDDEEKNGQFGQFACKRSADIDSHKSSDSIGTGERPSLDVAVRLDFAILRDMRLATFRVSVAEGSSNRTNLGFHSLGISILISRSL